MVFKSIIGATCACLAVVTFSADAALVSRLGGLAVYDNVTDLTWLTDANYAMTSGYDADGLMNWADANAWAAGLNVGGIDGWRLASALNDDGSGPCAGYNCTGSEMGNLFYNVLGGTEGTSIVTNHNSNYDLFSNVQSDIYWSATDFAANGKLAWVFGMGDGLQDIGDKTINIYAWPCSRAMLKRYQYQQQHGYLVVAWLV